MSSNPSTTKGNKKRKLGSIGAEVQENWGECDIK
jgi:hypothetical protein